MTYLLSSERYLVLLTQDVAVSWSEKTDLSHFTRIVFAKSDDVK